MLAKVVLKSDHPKVAVSPRYDDPLGLKIKEEAIFLTITAENLKTHMGKDHWKGPAL